MEFRSLGYLWINSHIYSKKKKNYNRRSYTKLIKVFMHICKYYDIQVATRANIKLLSGKNSVCCIVYMSKEIAVGAMDFNGGNWCSLGGH